MAKVVLIDPLYSTPAWNVASDWLGAEHEVVAPAEYTPEAIEPLLPESEGILTVFRPVSPDMMDMAPNLKVVAKPGAGVDNIDVDAANERGVMVCNVEGVRGRSVAEHAFFMALYVARHAWMKDQQETWEHMPAVQLGGKSLGIVGLGDIGRRAARIGNGFGMELLINTRTEDPSYVPEADLEFTSFDALLPRADFLILCMPLAPEMRGIMNKANLLKMKADAILINVSRGPAVVSDDLLEVMRGGHLAGAGLDVTDPEPLPKDHGLWGLENVIISPHHASRTPETQVAAMERTAENMRLALGGQRPVNIVNPGVM